MSQIHKAKLGVMADISRIGIGKVRRNTQQGYNFRGVEDAMNELSPILIKHGITVSAKYSDLDIRDRAKGDPAEAKATRFVTLKGVFIFSAEDGSSFASEVYGEAMDSGDKAVVKAQSVAFRTALFQEFVVPTMAIDPEEYEDGDAGGDGEGSELDGFRAAALKGSKALEKHFAEHKPAAGFWKRHRDSLKAAATKADAETRQ